MFMFIASTWVLYSGHLYSKVRSAYMLWEGLYQSLEMAESRPVFFFDIDNCVCWPLTHDPRMTTDQAIPTF